MPIHCATYLHNIVDIQHNIVDTVDMENNTEPKAMTTAIPTANYELAANITAFLVEQKGSALKIWKGKMTKAEQVELFGRYFGKGNIWIDGENETVSHSVKVCFGTDWAFTAEMKFDGTMIFENK